MSAADAPWSSLLPTLAGHDLRRRTGKVVAASELRLEATGIAPRLGEVCELTDFAGRVRSRAEVIGYHGDVVLLAPFGPVTGISRDVQVVPTGQTLRARIDQGVLGRVLDALGQPIDEKGPLGVAESSWVPLDREPPPPLSRREISNPFVTGVAAIDALLTCGEGQRIAVMAPAGVGKSTLLGMLARRSACDVAVIGLVGERGREVGEFVHRILGSAIRRAVVVASTSDRPALERMKAAHLATAVAEHFRDRGARVLLMVDSLTRHARALREIGLSRGEPAVRRGFTPSVFAELPRLLERAGQGPRGSITAFYTVLMEDEDVADPVAEEVKSILDGHIVLSRALAQSQHYPAIDVLQSVSRVMDSIVAPAHRAAAGEFRTLMAAWQRSELLVRIGEYKPGSDRQLDHAIASRERMMQFLREPADHESSAAPPLDATVAAMREAVGTAPPVAVPVVPAEEPAPAPVAGAAPAARAGARPTRGRAT
jgi:type III secretion protein N (ATPase)